MITTTAIEGGIYFSIFYLLSVLFSLAGFLLIVHRNKLPVIPYMLTLLSAIVFLLIGTKLFTYSLDDWKYLWNNHVFPFTDHKTILGGIAGGIFGLLLAGTWFGIKESLLDRFAILLPVGMAIQRFGCLFAGCCFGESTSLPWGITYGKDSLVYHAQLKEGLISDHAITSLPVHPDQIYHIIFCSLIALIVWKKSYFLKAKGSKFLFSILLYLVFRFFEEFTRFAPHHEQILIAGLKAVQWKLMIVISIITLIILLREKFTLGSSIDVRANVPLYKSILLLVTIPVIVITAGDWFLPIERLIIWMVTLPVVVVLAWKLILLFITERKYRFALSFMMIAVILMSQTTIKAPKDSLASYFSMTMSAFTGRFYHFHDDLTIAGSYYNGGGCGGGTVYNNRERFSHDYSGGSAGINYTEYFSRYQRFNAGLNVEMANDKEQSPDSAFKPQRKQFLYALNPSVKFEGRWFGFGAGFQMGKVALDMDNSEEKRIFAGSYNIRFGPYDILFTEVSESDRLSGFGEKVFEWSIGSGFGVKNAFLKGGSANKQLFLHVLLPIDDQWLMEPYVRFGSEHPTYDNHTDHTAGPVYRLTMHYIFKNKYKHF